VTLPFDCRVVRRLGFGIGLAFASACAGDSLIPGGCTDNAVPSIQVMVRDAATDDYLGPGSTFVQRSGSYADSVSLPLDYDLPYELELTVVSAFERAGTYRVIVGRDGYATWERTNVHVGANSCHVETVRLEARLEALP
jgi:hypothetical protein